MPAPLTTTIIAAAATMAAAAAPDWLIGAFLGLGLGNQLLVEYAASRVTDNGPG